MCKAAIAAVSAFLMLANCEANAMTLGSLRPNIVRSVVQGKFEHASESTGFSWVIAMASAAIEQLHVIARSATTHPEALVESIDI